MDISAPNKLGPWQSRPLTNSTPTNILMLLQQLFYINLRNKIY